MMVDDVDVEIGSQTDPKSLALALDKASHAQRLAWLYTLSPKKMAQLFEECEGSLPLDAEFFVPQASEDLSPVVHHGFNNLPLFRRFQKVMFRNADGMVAGRNAQAMAWATGPGYFVVGPRSSGDPIDGSIVFDYVKQPVQTPVNWPDVIPNHRGLSYFVYRGSRDVMRRISSHVSVGRLVRLGKVAANFFVLVREDKAVGDAGMSDSMMSDDGVSDSAKAS